MFKNRRGQAAMEFLMTYGWAILVVLVVIGALAYYGVLSPENLLQDRCVFNVALECDDYLVTAPTTPTGLDGSVKISLKNNLGEDITVTSIELIDPDLGPAGESVCGGALPAGSAAGVTPVVPTKQVTIKNGRAGVVNSADTRDATGATIDCTPGDAGDKEKFEVRMKYFTTQPGFEHTLVGDLFSIVER